MSSSASAPGVRSAVRHRVIERGTRGLWRHLPVLLIASAVCGVGVLVSLAIARGSVVILLALAPLLVGPTLLPLFRVMRRILLEDDSDLRGYLASWRGRWWLGILFLGVPAGSLLLALLGLAAAQESGAWVYGISAALATGVGVLSTAVGVVGLPLAAARPALGLRRMLLSAAYVLRRWPWRFVVPAVALTAAALLLPGRLSPALLVVPGLLASAISVPYWLCAIDLGAKDVQLVEEQPRR
ncbi:MAG: hypothetical protein Q4G40_00185 [Brachybacterium sp.]|nr:hypothetical protein [Brachybacterium sp.]